MYKKLLIKERARNQQLTEVMDKQQKEISELKVELTQLHRVSNIRLKELAEEEVRKESYTQIDIEQLVARKEENEKIEMLLMTSREETPEEIIKTERHSKDSTEINQLLSAKNSSNKVIYSFPSFGKLHEPPSKDSIRMRDVTDDREIELKSESSNEFPNTSTDQRIYDSAWIKNPTSNNKILGKESPLKKVGRNNLRPPISNTFTPNKQSPIHLKNNSSKTKLLLREGHLMDYIGPVKLKTFEKLKLVQSRPRHSNTQLEARSSMSTSNTMTQIRFVDKAHVRNQCKSPNTLDKRKCN